MKFQEFMDRSSLVKTHQDYQNYFTPLRKELKVWHVNINEALILLALFFEKNAEAHPSQLSHTLSLPKHQISHCLRTLQQQGLVRVGLNQDDRRKRTIVLAKKGKALSPKLVSLFDHWENRLEQNQL